MTVDVQGLSGGIDNWAIHMKGASNIVLGLINVLLSPTPFPETGGSPPSSVSSHTSQGPLFNEEEAALKFLVGMFAWLDITGCVSLGSSPVLTDYHQRLLGGANPPVRLDKISGCQNWVMIYIGKIASLDEWRRKSQRSRTLSMIELVQKATQLETELKSALSDFVKNRKSSTDVNKSLFMPHLTPLTIYADYVTEVYGTSALTYLHVVVSGAYPELPEIRDNVVKTMEMLKQIPSPLLTRSLWWPMLITASMAVGEEQDFCRSLVAAAGVNDSSPGIGYNIFRTMEECWRRQEMNNHDSQGDGYWGEVMNSLQIKSLVM